MGLTFFELYRRLHEADTPPPPPNNTAPSATPPPPAPDPLAMGGVTAPPPAPGGDPSMGGVATTPTGKPKIIKITTVWDALENALGGKAQKPKTKEHPPEKQQVTNAQKSLYT